MSAANPVTGTMQVLAASARIAGEGGGPSIDGGDLPKRVTALMPTRAILVTPSGGPAATGDTVPTEMKRVDVRCYGRTAHEAYTLAVIVELELKAWTRSVTTDHLVYGFTRTSGPVQMRDPDGDWPMSIVSFLVRVADERVPA